MTLTPIQKSVRTAAKEAGKQVLIPLGVAIAGGVAANQVPQNRKSSKKAVRDITKSLVPIVKSDLPWFNHEYAQKCAELVMKMDDDEAYLFTTMVMDQVFQDDVAANEKTLQRHLNEVVEKRLEMVKKALASSISKGLIEETDQLTQLVETFEKAVSNPYTTGDYHFEESDFRRDPRTGRFMTKVRVNPRMDKLGDKQAQNLGIDVSNTKYKKLNDEQKARFQQEYMQVVNFINVAQGIGGSGAKVAVQVDDGNRKYWKDINAKPSPEDWDPKADEKVIAVEARPEGGLTLGGAAFALAPSMSRNSIQSVNAASNKFPQFSEDWTADVDPENSNARLYHRTLTGGQFLMDTSPEESKRYLAGHWAKAVGTYGPQAEKVIGPTMRKTAYRYRGVEKTPDATAVREYENARSRALNPETLGEADRRTLRARQSRALAAAKTRKAMSHGKMREGVDLTKEETAEIRGRIERAFMENLPREDNPNSVDAGVTELARYLLNPKRPGVPKKDLYRLQLESGNTPPSEGFIIDKDGKVVTQAVGYGDDHYLPFNLKNLAKVRGGEYIRTRSVGGPTSEDIYAGLMSGAKRVTVVSRSGVFSIEFESDFKGKRRYNDKALRMTRRYEALLDTIQSETLERPTPVSEQVRHMIAEQVHSEGYDRTEYRQEVKDRVAAYKQELTSITDEGDLRDFVNEAIQTRAEQIGSDLTTQQREVLASQMRNDWKAQNQFKFQLNGPGYRDALRALQEQFPYYFKTRYQTFDERIETELDSGYVEPGRNRPTAAKAGLFGTKEHKGKKFSASDADYQTGRRIKVADAKAPASTSTSDDAKTSDGKPNIKQEMENRKSQVDFAQAAAVIHGHLRKAATPENLEDENNPVSVTPEDFPEWIKNQRNAQKFIDFYDTVKAKMGNRIPAADTRKFIDAVGRVDRKPYDKHLALNANAKPFLFEEKPYQADASDGIIRGEAKKLAARTKPLSSDRPLNEMTDDEISNELRTTIRVHELLDGVDNPEMRRAILKEQGLSGPGVARLVKEGAIDQHLEDVHRQRALNLKLTDRTPAPVHERVVHKEPRRVGDQQQRDIRKELQEHIKTVTDIAQAVRIQGHEDLAREFYAAAGEGKELLKEASLEPAHVAAWLDTDEVKSAMKLHGPSRNAPRHQPRELE